MAGTLKITLQNDTELIAKLRAKGPRIIEVLMTKMSAVMIQLASYVVSQKLSGQVLQRRTGILSGSVVPIPATLEGTNVVGAVQAGGSAAGMYAGVHEYGGTRFYTIMATKARALAFIAGDGAKVFIRPPRMVIHPPEIPRPFMGPSLDENASQITADLNQSLLDTLKE